MTRIPLFPVLHDGPPDVHVWRVDIRFDTSLESDTFTALSSDERTQARVFRRSEDALRFATVRAALREQLASALGTAPHMLRLTRDAMKRPCLAEATSIDFNVSHSGAHGLIALSTRRRVGVDIEQRNPQLDWRALASLTLADSETVALEQLHPEECIERFYDAWVAKEALLKTTGVGVVLGLPRLTVLPRDGVRVALRDTVPDEAHDLAASWLAAPAGYAACAAWSMTAGNLS
ncbi:4'-phosphopantetheinyl transferase family protein [Paraburkholderia phenazinium]|uniref:4'-phosphopantetheinyl transferase n=1 Tax=Paraburkholderia phenazinium TaxID=60549 RepID=A0A1G8LP90_9BURK|nr:4'-phosphopantetheinyl transferase superfamily protein [Paraburkholderia phenazinium]SDI57267.1 4'-phosphopantetheinyl transferase [Paraburkholderia phenazinium]